MQSQFKNFISKIGGQGARDNIKRILERLFTNEVAIKCLWKGKKNNFRVNNLNLIIIMKEIILDTHPTVKEIEFETECADWLRFAKQRFDRENKKKE
ncbi:uncharacterized protein LOC113561593 [Ooceraea biroi]|uniref:uncharacterized protein LOC113561593 n=1 Tax=Ooceraea biroi TaxID=2015173 RepID=UPI000F07FEE2|nr:uncharacterized protein LOC113561593 [Ooceraea biroi]